MTMLLLGIDYLLRPFEHERMFKMGRRWPEDLEIS